MYQTPRGRKSRSAHLTPFEIVQLYDESSNEETKTECFIEDGDLLEFEEDQDFVVGWSEKGNNYVLPRGCGVTVTYKKPKGVALYFGG